MSRANFSRSTGAALIAAALLLPLHAVASQATPARPQAAPVQPVSPRPTLVVMLTIDQLRPDYLTMWERQFTGGLARLLKGGAVFLNGFQDHANTETAPGHASTLSGRFPRSTGIVSNTLGVYDPQFPLIGARGSPASPYRFRGTTLIDWLRFCQPDVARALGFTERSRRDSPPGPGDAAGFLVCAKQRDIHDEQVLRRLPS